MSIHLTKNIYIDMNNHSGSWVESEVTVFISYFNTIAIHVYFRLGYDEL